MLKIVCDRCYTERPVEIAASSYYSPYTNMGMTQSAKAYPVLNDWKEVQSKHVCSVCVEKLDKFLDPIMVRE